MKRKAAENKRPRSCAVATFAAVFVGAAPPASVAGVPEPQRHYQSHKYHLTPLQEADVDIKLLLWRAAPSAQLCYSTEPRAEPFSST